VERRCLLPCSLRRSDRVELVGAGCRVQGAGCRVQGAGCRVQGAGCRAKVLLTTSPAIPGRDLWIDHLSLSQSSS